MRKMFSLLDRALRYVAVILVLAMLAILALQVAMRYVGNIALSWSEELSLLGFAWVIVIAGAVGIRSGLHSRMAFLVENLSTGLQPWCERVIAALVLFLGVVMLFSGWSYVQETEGMYSAAIRYPMIWLYAAAPVFGALIAIFSLESLIYGGPQEVDS
ncbi:C4-dicarboxylate transport system permease small protein [Pusillimonas sp. T7-7]|uniref:TRAP transporter small permease n=1 Tax=Pusillimonas sp. (strain T7-7) TaxID=1007105 RepID=UPI0002084F73|nr:TRAP transporter small permease [Pusillimonas sp. T7-7]AEC21788.1 C4-dicarboxylate transport system permease small protein [Pusillimonas sp. T7-7]